MSRYFGSQGYFDFHLFMSDLLEGIDSAVQSIFGGRRSLFNIGKLSRVTPNIKYDFKKCVNCVKFNSDSRESQLLMQCKSCVVTTSQTKMGACLQFEWKQQEKCRSLRDFEKCYCSIDLVPVMLIKQIETVSSNREIA